MFALLSTAPYGRCTRSYLQETLWGTACYDTGRQSLRRALADIKRVMGEAYGELLAVNNAEVTLDLSKVEFLGRPGNGEFLEGLDVKEDGFNDWLRAIRLSPEQIHSLFGLSTQAPPKPIVPTLAILPFRLVLGGEEHAILGDWLAEEVCRSLSRSNLLAVISHLSTRELARRQIALTDVRSALAADYCVHGSVRVVGEQVILDADFLDAKSGRILWTRRFSGGFGELFGEHSETISDLVCTIGRTVASEAIDRSRRSNVRDLADHIPLVAGVGLMHELRLASFAKSRELIREAIRRAPRSAEAHAWLGEWYVMSIFNGWSTDVAADTRAAMDCTARALDIDPENSFGLTIDGVVYNNLRQELDTAEKRFDAALDFNPNESMSWLLKGALFSYKDAGKDAISCVEKAKSLSPLDPFSYFYNSLSASAYLADEDYETALDLAERSFDENGRHVSTLRVKICALHNLGRSQDARQTAELLLRRQPRFTVDNYLRNHPASEHKSGQNVAQALRQAGIP
ncbi:MAG: hypothetical protein AAF441_05485 [Pseudomonadota bacterium]